MKPDTTTQLLAISVRQPYATLIMMGLKRIETKTTNTKHRGAVMIHASNTMGTAERLAAEAEGLDSDALPRGALLGCVDVVDAQPVEKIEGLSPDERRRGDYRHGRWGWTLDRPQLLAEPIPCKGALSFWKVSGEIASAMRAELSILERVFVYGTLKRGQHNHRLLSSARFVGTDSIRGRMYNYGHFPAVALVGRGHVHGELYAVDSATMERLDCLEGCPSFYQRARVSMSTGGSAWVYIMDKQKLEKLRVIPSGNWGTE